MLTCACGKPATMAIDTFKPGRQAPVRLLVCGLSCPIVDGLRAVVLLDGPDFFAMMSPTRSTGRSALCWCDMRRLGAIVPFCPQHGKHK